MELQVGKIYNNGRRIRKVINIEDENVFYETETGKTRECGILIFKDWVEGGKKVPRDISYIYEIIYEKNGVDYIVMETIIDIEEANKVAQNCKTRKGVTNVRIIEHKTVVSTFFV